MKSIGEFMSSARSDRKITLDKIEETTKIKKNFVKSIEKENWDDLPEFAVVLGFVKVLANLYEIDESKSVALLRRDYPPRSIPINPKPDVDKSFVWSPKLTFATVLVFVSLIVFSYLGYQLYQYNLPPDLEVTSPLGGQRVVSDLIEVSGSTNSESSVTVNNQPVFVDEDGNFNSSLKVSSQTNEVVIVSRLRSGKETTLQIPIEVSRE